MKNCETTRRKNEQNASRRTMFPENLARITSDDLTLEVNYAEASVCYKCLVFCRLSPMPRQPRLEHAS